MHVARTQTRPALFFDSIHLKSSNEKTGSEKQGRLKLVKSVEKVYVHARTG